MLFQLLKFTSPKSALGIILRQESNTVLEDGTNGPTIGKIFKTFSLVRVYIIVMWLWNCYEFYDDLEVLGLKISLKVHSKYVSESGAHYAQWVATHPFFTLFY